jgi:hypothetical protein
MAFELGIDIGCRLFAQGKEKNKKCLILEKERYRIRKALSDLSGADIKSHNNEPENIVRAVRDWFVENGLKRVTNANAIWQKFNNFMADFYQQRKKEGSRIKILK